MCVSLVYPLFIRTNTRAGLVYYLFIMLLSINVLIMLCNESISVKNAHHNFPDPKVMSSNSLFCNSTSPKAQESLFIIINYKEEQQNLTFKRLCPANV